MDPYFDRTIDQSVIATANSPISDVLVLSASGTYFTAVGVPRKNPIANTFCAAHLPQQV